MDLRKTIRLLISASVFATTLTVCLPTYAGEQPNKIGSFFKKLKKDVMDDIKDPNRKREMAAEKTQVIDGFKGLGTTLKPKGLDKEVVVQHEEITRKNTKLIKRTKAKKKPLKEGVWLIDSKKVKTGYVKEYEIVRKKLVRGEFSQLDPFYKQYYKDFQAKYGGHQAQHLVQADKDLLRVYERASMYLYAGDFERAINAFALAEEIVYPKDIKGKALNSAVKWLSKSAEVISGIEELSPYEGAGWEKTLALNYKTIAHLLNGERSAYNVTRRAIDLQNSERETFKQNLAKAKKKEKKFKKKADKKGFKAFGLVIDDHVKGAYKKPNIKGRDVMSAYVNPLGFYIAGMVQEYDAYDDPSLTTNALISYRKAAELNPKSRVIKKAVADLEKNGVKTSGQTIHILLANGFAPEKKVITTRFIVDEDIVTIQLPIQEQRYAVARTVEVYNGKTKLATLDQIADIEALALRHQADSEPFQLKRARVAAWRALGQTKLFSAFGAVGTDVMIDLNERNTPDMRAWLSLPEEVLGARIKASKKISRLTIVTKNSKGKVIGKKTVKLNKNGANFVFARSMGGNLTVHNNKKHWIRW